MQAGAAHAGKSANKHRLTAWLLVLPFVVLYALFLIYPAIRVCYLSLTNSDIAGQGQFTSFDNFITLFRDGDFWASVIHTAYFVLLTVVPNTVLGFIFALLVVRLKRFRLFVLACFFLPFVLPVSVTYDIAIWVLDTNFGIVNLLLGSNIAWFQDLALAMPSVAGVTIWWTVGFNMLLFVAGLQNIPQEYYEAAALDGASGFHRFVHITCPLIWPVGSLVLVIQLILQFKIFDQIYLLTLGGPFNSTVVVLLYMYRQAFLQGRGGYAAAIALMLVLIIIVASLIQFRLLRIRRTVA
ncbi:MAG TPA: sugar ABC transporter permease [Chthoniobacterales bacterium]|nr:sugar ABC transporter permease [Chthoniobacterales bacterium]